MCGAPAAPAPSFLAPRAAPTPALASPCLATLLCHPPEPLSAAARHYCSSTGATSCSWQSPRIAPRSTTALVLPAVFFRTRHAAPAIARASPAAATLAADRQHQLSLTVPFLQLEAHP
jgi:hypothetical protein